ncbi:MAG: hypothetical protein M1835_005192 [Candelina submexicana]|nr:MAG: hypothetical protein M1835_005192 [Candelina submexicana]
MARPRSRRGPKQIAAFAQLISASPQLISASHNSGTSMITTEPVGASTTSSYHTATGRAPTESQPSAFHLSSLEIVKRRRICPQNTTRVVESCGVQYGGELSSLLNSSGGLDDVGSPAPEVPQFYYATLAMLLQRVQSGTGCKAKPTPFLPINVSIPAPSDNSSGLSTRLERYPADLLEGPSAPIAPYRSMANSATHGELQEFDDNATPAPQQLPMLPPLGATSPSAYQEGMPHKLFFLIASANSSLDAGDTSPNNASLPSMALPVPSTPVANVPSKTMIITDGNGELVTITYTEDASGLFHCSYCPMIYGTKQYLRRHNEEKHVAIHRYECIICGKVLTRRHGVKQHFPACVKDNGNPNNYSWDHHPSCKLEPKRAHKTRKAKAQTNTTVAGSSRQSSDQPPSIAEYSSINRNHMDSLVGMGLGCVTRSIDRGTTDWGSLGVAQRNLAITLNDNATVARMDALVHVAAQGAGVEPAAKDDEEEEEGEEAEEDDDDEMMS